MSGYKKQNDTNQHLVPGTRHVNVYLASNQRELRPQLVHQLVWTAQSQNLN